MFKKQPFDYLLHFAKLASEAHLLIFFYWNWLSFEGRKLRKQSYWTVCTSVSSISTYGLGLCSNLEHPWTYPALPGWCRSGLFLQRRIAPSLRTVLLSPASHSPITHNETSLCNLFNPLDSRGNYSVTSNWYTGRWWVGCYIFGTARRGLGGAAARLGHSSLYQM